jgi:ABC-type multidrug transport system fused ATPase/permease subunit
MSAGDQVWLAVLSVGVALLGTAPIEIQRRMVNAAIKDKNFSIIFSLALIYGGLVLGQGVLKLLLNVYRSWTGARAIRVVRTSIDAMVPVAAKDGDIAASQGTKISMIVSEADAIGGFIGDCVSEPVLEGSILAMVLVYMVFMQPMMALATVLILATQVVFVPVLQRAINRRVQKRITVLRAAGAGVITESEKEGSRNAAERYGEVYRLDMGIFSLKFSLNFLMNITTHFGNVVILALGGWFVMQGRTQAGTVVAFLSGLSNIIDPWGEIVNWFQNLWVTSAKYQLLRDAALNLYEASPPERTAMVPATALEQSVTAVQSENVVEHETMP